MNKNTRNRRPYGRFGDPAAEVVWGAIEVLDEASKHAVLRALGDRLAVDPLLVSGHQAREARAVSALQEARDLLGRSPSVREYVELREVGGERDWPREAQVRRWLGGSWNRALERAGMDVAPSADVVVREQVGSAFGKEEVVAALRACAESLGQVPTFLEYYVWTGSPDGFGFPGRKPKSVQVFCRLFGSFAGALAAAGLASGVSVRVSGDSRIRPLLRKYTREQAIEGVRLVAERLGKLPTPAEYTRVRAEIQEKSVTAGAPRAVPSDLSVRRHFPNWSDALAAAREARG